MTRRTKLEIFLNVLWIIKNGTNKPTNIMYGANLSWKPVQKILKSMVSHGFISEIDTQNGHDKRTIKCYEITQEGEEVVKYFNLSKSLIEPWEIVNNLY